MDDFFEDLREKREEHSLIDKISAIPSNYVGSKRRLLPHIVNAIKDRQIKFDSVLDAFSGSAMVSMLFKFMGKTVYANDLLTSSAITAICLLECDKIPVSESELNFLCNNHPKEHGTFVLDNYKDKFFTEKECNFLDRFKENVVALCGEKFYCGMELLSKATLASIPNSNFSVYGKSLKNLRSIHNVDKSFWTEKWRDTTRKRRDDNNEIMFGKALKEMYSKYKGAFSLFAVENHINQNCFLGGRYYNGQTIAKLEHRIKHIKNDGQDICYKPVTVNGFKEIITSGSCCVFNSDIIDLLESKALKTDFLYLDPPYGNASSDYAILYRFLEEYLYECKLEDMEHIQRGAKRFCKSKGYQEQFENLLSLCGDFGVWMISYNDSSYANLDVIKSTIKNAGKKEIDVIEVPITYQYRKGKNVVESDFKKYLEEGKTHLQRGVEYLILAR